MKPFWKELAIALFMGVLLPGLLLNMAVALRRAEHPQQTEPVPQQPSQTTVKPPLRMRLRLEDGTVTEMDMDTYLVGVVAAEMPASFEMEALKAQAVVARTYTLKAYTTGGKHGDGSVCTNYACCQAYTEDIKEENRENKSLFLDG